MKIILFGTGDYYRKYRKWFRDEDIVALLDNDSSKHGTIIDGKTVCSPAFVSSISFEWIVILSVYTDAMFRQLVELGVPGDSILKYSDLIYHKDLIKNRFYSGIYVDNIMATDMISNLVSDKTVLFMSHNLDLNGASLALFYFVLCTKKYGFNVVFASWNDGKLRNALETNGIPVIIDPNLEMSTSCQIEWVQQFTRIVCNTVNYYQFLSKKNDAIRFMWWLHDPDYFYHSLNVDILRKINFVNIKVYSAGMPASDAIRNVLPELGVDTLFYGIPVMSESESVIIDKSIFDIAVIANVQEYKGIDVLVSALELLDEQVIKTIRLTIVGNNDSGYAVNQIERLENIGIDSNFIPFMDRTEINSLLDKIDVLVCPSRQDVMPVTVCEAMQKRVPCIISDSVGTYSLVEDRNNCLTFRNEDHRDLKECIEWALSNKEELEQIGVNGFDIYEKYFSMPVFEYNVKKVLNKCFDL